MIGFVYNKDGTTPLEGAVVKLKNISTSLIYESSKTDKLGVFKLERIDEGLEKGLTPGVDREASPACVISCPTKAMHFGDLDDPYSEINRLIKEKKGRAFHPEYDTQPSIYYID